MKEYCIPNQAYKIFERDEYDAYLEIPYVDKIIGEDGIIYESTGTEDFSGERFYHTFIEPNNDFKPIWGDTIVPVDKSEVGLAYTDESKDEERMTIGHLRFDYGAGNEFWTSWWEHNKRYNSLLFSHDLDVVINELRKPHCPLHNLKSMGRFCWEHPESKLKDETSYVFKIETKWFKYIFRIVPERGWYNYVYCYRKEELNV